MSSEINIICALILSLKFSGSSGLYFSKIVPEDISTGSAVVYGFAPKLKIGNDNRIGFGFKFGNHADFQILYEFGPQTSTKSLQTVRSRSASYRQYQRKPRRRPFLEFLIRTGLLEVKPVENYALNIRNTNIKSRA